MCLYNYDVLARYIDGVAAGRITLTALDASTIQLSEKRYDPLTGDEIAETMTEFAASDLESLKDGIDEVLIDFSEELAE